MTTGMMTIYWNELMTNSPNKAMEYYGAIAGWEFAKMDMSPTGYWVASLGEGPLAGIMDTSEIPEMLGMPDTWMSYISVPDVDAAVATTLAQGGRLNGEITDMPGIGRFAMVVDPVGAAYGLITPSD